MKKKKQSNTNIINNFKIPQIPKIEGIRGVKKYEKMHFVSPLFGTRVKDEVVAPFEVKVEGDKVKKYDAFRTKPKMNNKNDYYEFDIIDQNTRSEIFGGKTYDKKELEKTNHVQQEDPFRIKPIQMNNEVEEVKEKKVTNVDEIGWLKNKQVVNSIKPDEDELTLKVYERKVVSEPTFDSDFESFDEPVKVEVKPTTEKPREFKPENVSSQKTPKAFSGNQKTYRLPNVSIFKKIEREQDTKPQWLLDQIEIIDQTLVNHAVDGHVNGSTKGPTVTRYEIALEPGVNVKRVVAIQDNLMMNLAAKSLRIEAPIPGKPYVGIEVANKVPETVAFGNVVDQKEFLEDHDHPLKVALGVDIDGKNIYVDIAKMPHGLIAGATNSGKSVSVNTILVSLLLKNTPDDLKLILIDPKMVELTPYNDLPHLITPVITDPKMASSALNWAVEEMERRYKTFANSRSRDIKTFNDNVERGLTTEGHMPYIVIIIDELADLMMVAPHDVEDAIQRLTQKARAAGIHLLVATQRPTTDVVKGTIKSNIPSRIAFKVASFVDSTTILDGAGAESLLGRGDMLLKEGDRPIRLQGAYIPDEEIFEVTDFIREQQGPSYIFQHEDLKRQIEFKETVTDDLFNDVALFVVKEQNASINSLCKEFNIGFNRAQKLVSLLEDYGIVSTGQGTKAREVLVTEYELDEILNN